MKKRFTSIALIIAIIISLTVIPTEVNAASKVTSYTYEVTALLAPFNGYVYVKTNNPDPTSFRLIDKSSKYITSTSSDSYGKGIYHFAKFKFLDVEYEKESTFRVKGGYIFVNYNYDSDGGKLVVQEAISANPAGITFSNGRISSYSGDMSQGWADTSKTVTCPTLKSYTDYLIDTYTNSSMSFFEKLDAVQAGLTELSLYPRGLSDSSKRDPDNPYPFFAASPYVELGLNKHYDVYQGSEEPLLITRVYPFILDSASFPGTMSAVARKLEPECTTGGTSYHWLVDITFNGETKSYGGAGSGGSEPILTKRVTKDFRFNNLGNDFGTHATLNSLKNRLLKYGEYAVSDNAEIEAQLSRETVGKTIAPGCWVLVATEGWFGYGKTYSYIALAPDGEGYTVASGAWVDGRYVNEYERIELGVKFSDYPEADIIVRNVSYTDKNGKQHQSDILYSYDSETDTWRAPYYYNAAWWYTVGMELFSQFILTREQVENMGVDRNTNLIPDNGRIYDGSDVPGTPFTNIHAKSISVPKEMTITTGVGTYIPVTFNPTNPTDTQLKGESSNEEIVEAGSGGYVRGKKPGTATVTITTVDGGKQATCKVTVVQGVESIAINDNSSYEYIDYGAKKKLSATILPSDAFDKSLEWTSSAPDIVSVDSKGNVTGKALGYALITAKNKASGVEDYIYIYVEQVKIDNTKITLSTDKVTYTGKEHKPKVTVTNGKVTLVEGTDYKVTYSNNVDATIYARVKIEGIGNYTGSITKMFTIEPIKVQVPEGKTGLVYNGKSQVGVPSGANYTITGNKGTDAGEYYATATLPSSNYTWSDGYYWDKYIRWEIAKYNVSKASVSAIADQIYTGTRITPKFTVKRGTVELVENVDYYSYFDNNIEIGKATLTIIGLGNYTGEKKVTFNIVPPPHTHTLKKTAAKAATCTKAGTKAYWKCTECGKVYSDSKATKETTVAKMKVVAKGHQWDSGKVTTPATETKEGVKTYTCTVCNATKTEIIPKLEPKVVKTVRRTYGDNRYDTAFAISDAYLVDSGKVKSLGSIIGTDRSPSLGAIIVACGTNYPDALAASYLASVKKAPVIVWREKDNAKVQEYIRANLKRGGYVYIMGGTGAVSGNIAKGLSGYKFVRYGDENRYGTNVKILTASKVTGGEILVCDGTDFKNALIASATGKPILLVKPTGVTREGLGFIASLKNPSFTIIGNESSVAPSVATQLAPYGKVTRISGNTPDEVSVNVAKKYFKNPKEVMVATSETFPDGLCGGPLAIQNKAPMLLLTDKQNSKSVAYTKTLTSLERITAFGGTAVVSNALTKKLLNMGTKATDILEYYRTTDDIGRPLLMVDPGKI